LLVVNDTRVIPARLTGTKSTGGQVEVLLAERVSSDMSRDSSGDAGWREDWRALARGLGRQALGARLRFAGDVEAEILRRGNRGEVELRFSGPGQAGLLARLDEIGSVPLPPYIEAARRKLGTVVRSADDKARYQTVYARQPGAVAAPTAGLHFTEELMSGLQAAGHEIARITLHVGPGTFRPVTTPDIEQHRLDAERYEVSEAAARSLRHAQAQGRPIVAVGTTVVRTLETLARLGPLAAGSGSTRLFLVPGAEFRVVTDLVTNFHLPRSSLLMLVAAFAGRDRVLDAYRDAIERGYRFYSYGDAMFIRPGSVLS
jgi:S-adenosylmethionine:tRNA ribosyltransferase-isomerase